MDLLSQNSETIGMILILSLLVAGPLSLINFILNLRILKRLAALKSSTQSAPKAEAKTSTSGAGRRQEEGKSSARASSQTAYETQPFMGDSNPFSLGSGPDAGQPAAESAPPLPNQPAPQTQKSNMPPSRSRRNPLLGR